MHFEQRDPEAWVTTKRKNADERIDRPKHGRSIFLCGGLYVRGSAETSTGASAGELNAHLVQGCEFVSHGFGFDVLIGRDILCKGSFTLTFDGHFTLAF